MRPLIGFCNHSWREMNESHLKAAKKTQIASLIQIHSIANTICTAWAL